MKTGWLLDPVDGIVGQWGALLDAMLAAASFTVAICEFRQRNPQWRAFCSCTVMVGRMDAKAGGMVYAIMQMSGYIATPNLRSPVSEETKRLSAVAKAGKTLRQVLTGSELKLLPVTSSWKCRGIPEELEDEIEAVRDDYRKELPPPRKAYSSPTQRTPSVLDGEFIADPSIPHVPSTAKKTHQQIKLVKEASLVENVSHKGNVNRNEELFLSTNKLPWLEQKKFHSQRAETLKEEKSLNDLLHGKEITCKEKIPDSSKCPDSENSKGIKSFKLCDDKLKLESQTNDKHFSVKKAKDPHIVTAHKQNEKSIGEKEKLLPTPNNSLADFHFDKTDTVLKPAACSKSSSQSKYISVVNGEASPQGLHPNKNNTTLNHEAVDSLSSESSTANDERESLKSVLKAMSSLLGHGKLTEMHFVKFVLLFSGYIATRAFVIFHQ
ncbi:hypothetical protein PR048_012115 [Dryococelus australis]|uniref:Uncharacterized protein n=1 Tax=Dryococelus australis TaxID=614101 RepID=A0ABQ9HP38_9NEOP|nr:hypothetical protein PR048_012115 [Dryococelus australis]